MSISKKIILTNIVVTITAMVFLAVLIISKISYDTYNELTEDLTLSNDIMINKLEESSTPKFSFPTIVTNHFVYAYMYDYEKDEIHTNSKNPKRNFDKYKILAEALELEDDELQEVIIDEKRLLITAKTIEVDSEKIMVISAVANDDIEKTVTEIVGVLVLSLFVSGLCIILFLTLISKNILSPFILILRGIDRFSKKKFDEPILVDTKDEFKLLADELNIMADTLMKNDKEQRRFYEDFSHDLKTPITVISGYAQGLKSGIIENSDETLEIISLECDKLKKQIEDMIYISKLETTKENLSAENINLKEFLSQTISNIESLLILKEIDVEFLVEDVCVQADKEKLSKAVTNILSNAIKHTKDTIVIECKNVNDKIYIEISDNGKGYSQNVLQNPFSRLSEESLDGSNIGLSIVKKIIDKHKGEVRISNLESGGAKCTVILNKTLL